MHILITGGTGLIGRALINKLSGHHLTVLTRSPEKAMLALPAHVNLVRNLTRLSDFHRLDAVINLAGEPIIGKRWHPQQKEQICASRWDITQTLVQQILQAKTPPHTFISGSAVGYYGNQGQRILDETVTVNDSSFAHRVCANWENIALRAADKSRVCLLRTGIVLSPEGGALKKMMLPFQLGLGGPIGNGEQYLSWIHINDMVEGIIHLLHHPDAHGIFNLTAPNPVTNTTFSRTLSRSLCRPHFLATPKWALKIALGEASQLLLDSQRVIPSALEKSGYQFTFPKLHAALHDILAKKHRRA